MSRAAQGDGMPDPRPLPDSTAAVLRELAPYLAEEGIDLTDRTNPPDPDALPAALDRALARRNIALLTPVGRARDLAVTTLRLFVDAVERDDARLASGLLAQVVPESPDTSVAETAGCTGVALTALDSWLSGSAGVSHALARAVRLPRGDWPGRRVAVDVLALAAKGEAFDRVGALIARRGGEAVLQGAALALAAAAIAWAALEGVPVREVTAEHLG